MRHVGVVRVAPNIPVLHVRSQAGAMSESEIEKENEINFDDSLCFGKKSHGPLTHN